MPQPERRPKHTPAQERIVRDQAFVGQTIRIDGATFDGCSFTDCVLEYAGAGLGRFVRCVLTSTNLVFVEAADMTIQQLTLMYDDPAFRPATAGMLADIREGFEADEPATSPARRPFDA